MRAGGVAIACVVAAVVAVPLLERFPPVCFYRTFTGGHLCIFCGMTHALACAAHGDWTGAMAANPAWFLIFPAFVATITVQRGKLTWFMVAAALLGTLLRW